MPVHIKKPIIIANATDPIWFVAFVGYKFLARFNKDDTFCH